ncbi:hypothetical protein F4804DRAFT_178027 [Jackrogersella minutella]|nr:hypothetical protein F4804DRAFT_178027 [Jackrogersella minutella]
MPGEEMEITTDFGHTGFGEDIDIDLDFAVGQPDEDLELADFDQAQEIQNFNSDTRDELMAEGDDASYGMIDTDDIAHNGAAATANDIEIDLGDPDENLWQHNDIPHEETFENAAEIDYVEDANVSSTNVANATNGEGNWLERSTYSINKTGEGEVELAQTDVAVLDTTGGSLLRDTAVLTDDIGTQDFMVSEARDDTKASSFSGNDNAEGIVRGTFNEEQSAAAEVASQQPTEKLVTSQQGPYDDDVNEGITTGDVHDDVPHQTGDNGVSDTGYGQDDNIPKHEENTSLSVVPDHGSAGEHLAQQEIQADHNSVSISEISEQQLGSDSHAESANDLKSVDQAPDQGRVQVHDTNETHSQTDNYDAESADNEAVSKSQEGQISHAGATDVEHPLSIATRHEMYISYGQTDYRLFAKTEDDDPNQYFLRDMSALELPLSQFLSSLREVVADEVSPLDELVMHVDGLGLVFSESSASDILEEFTFGDILSLYDRLVKNDGAELAPCLYTFLMVRPNCHQRLMALLDSASSGRGLSEIAVYREATPVQDEQPGASDSHSPYIPPHGEGNDEADNVSYSSAQGEGDEGVYEYEQDDREEIEADEHDHDHEREVEDHPIPNSPSVHTPITKENTAEPAGQTKESEELTEQATKNNGSNIDGNEAVIDFSDDEDDLDLSSLKQGKSHPLYSPHHFSTYFSHYSDRVDCQCQDCFERSLEQLDIWTPTVSTFPDTSIANPNPFQQSRSSPQWTTASRTQNDSSLLGTQPSSNNVEFITNPCLLEDQANASPRDHKYSTEASNSNKHTPLANESVDAPKSDITSATATLNGDDNDEIDYSDDDDEKVDGGKDDPPHSNSGTSTSLKAPIDDEITWESENENEEDVKNVVAMAPKTTVQVSPPSGKRPRSNSDLLDGATEQNDVKRRRPS